MRTGTTPRYFLRLAAAVVGAGGMLLLAGCGPRLEAAAIAPTLSVVVRGDEATASLTGPAAAEVARRGEELFSIRVAAEDGANVPVLADYDLNAATETVTVRPRVSLTPGLEYEAVFEGPRLSPRLSVLRRPFTLSRDRGPSTSAVTALFPRQPELPANLLKFYVYFSEPMGEGSVFEHVNLLDAGGQPIEQAFNERELWADDHRRLTLWINPGRTKRALGLSEALGPVLEPDRAYTLEIGAGLPDRRGFPLGKPYRHSFRTAGFDREQPRLSDWELAPPPSGSRKALVVMLPEPLDHALATRLLRVETAAGQEVAGTAEVDADARVWSFRPEQAWTAGGYQLVVEGDLEDLAGNSLYRRFETPAGAGEVPRPEIPAYRRPFTVR